MIQQRTTTNTDPLANLVFDQNPVGLVVADSEGKFEKVNAEFCRMVGATHDECLQMTWQELFGFSKESLPHEFKKLKTGQSNNVTIERKFAFSSESKYRVQVKKIKTPDNMDFFYLAAVTQLNEVVSTLSTPESMQELNSKLQVSNEIAWQWNREQNKISWDQSLKNLGYNPQDVNPGFYWWIERIHEDDKERVMLEIERTFEQKKDSWTSEYRFQRKDKSFAILLDKAFIKYDDKKKASRVFGIKTDITEKRSVENEMRQAQIEALNANRVKAEFLANMSHEIKTPLSAILGFTDVLSDPQLSPSEKQNCIQTIKRNGHQLFQLVNEVLDLSKLESGKFEIKPTFIPFKELILPVSSSMKFKAEEKGLVFNLKIDRSVPEFVKTDPTRLQQVLYKLLGNAIKFTESGGVSVSFRFKKPLTPTEEGTLICRIEDSGIGIEAYTQARLFGTFQQADSSTTRKYGGTGLGLAISRKITNLLGGDVKLISSQPGQGSCFEISIKAGREAELEQAGQDFRKKEAAENSRKNKQFDFEGLKILLVDDSPDNRMLITRILARKGAEVICAENGEEGYKRALQEPFDVILMDVQMPVMGGNEATRILRESGYQRPVIAFTAHASKEDRERLLRAGFDEHLTKPIDQASLFSIIDHYGVRAEPPTLH